MEFQESCGNYIGQGYSTQWVTSYGIEKEDPYFAVVLRGIPEAMTIEMIEEAIKKECQFKARSSESIASIKGTRCTIIRTSTLE